jgi:hypothetical protein
MQPWQGYSPGPVCSPWDTEGPHTKRKHALSSTHSTDRAQKTMKKSVVSKLLFKRTE